MSKDKVYNVTLSTGETREVVELATAYFPAYVHDSTSTVWLTAKQIKDMHGTYKTSKDDMHLFFVRGTGHMRDWSEVFDFFKLLRTPIVKLELVE